VRICCQSVKDGVGQRWVVDVLIPFCYRQLRGDDDALFAIAVFEQLQEGKTEKAGNHFGYWFGVDWRMSPRHCTMRPIFRTRSGFTGSVDPTKNGVPTAMPISWQIFLRSGLSRTTPPITDSFRKPNNWTVS